MDDPLCAPCYQYTVISDPFGLSLFVLVRDIPTFYSTYNATLYETLMDQGFTHDYNKPIETFQGPPCEYVPPCTHPTLC